MSFSITVDGVTKSLNAIKPLPARLEARVVFLMAEAMHAGAQAGAARHNKTGEMMRSLFNRVVPGGRAVGHDLARAPQALWVNLGTKPHVILPKKGKALRWASGGGFRFAKRVNHPGYRGDPYLFNAADAAVRQFHAIASKAFGEVTK